MDEKKFNFISDFVHEYKKEVLASNRDIEIKVTTDLMNRASNSMRELQVSDSAVKSPYKPKP